MVQSCPPRGPPPVLQDPHCNLPTPQTIATRGRTTSQSLEVATQNKSPIRCELKFTPRAGADAIAVNKLCYITHPDMGDDAVAERRTGGSWKAKAQKLGNLCRQGEQMVQIHKVLLPNIRLIHVEERQPFRYLEDALVKSKGSNVFVKSDAKYIHKKST